MTWNWQQPDWPDFSWDRALLVEAEDRFQRTAGLLVGTRKHVVMAQDHDEAIVRMMCDEAVATSAIEGETLERESVQSSLRRELGLSGPPRRVRANEAAVSAVTLEVYRNFAEPLTESILFSWHQKYMTGRTDIEAIGAYRSFSQAMQVVSKSSTLQPKIHFEAPPSAQVAAEMERFLVWFDDTRPGGKIRLPAITRAGIAHLYFESIHPFEDGNGRVGRLLCEKSLAQSADEPLASLLSATIMRRRKEYYAELEMANTSNEITRWLLWFAGIVLESQLLVLATLEQILQKAKFFDRFAAHVNTRQQKALVRVFDAGIEGFHGGLSAANYKSITGASTATATRDLADLVRIGAMTQIGELRHRRYHLAIETPPLAIVTVNSQGRVELSYADVR